MYTLLTMKDWQAFVLLTWTIILSGLISGFTLVSGIGYIVEISITLSIAGTVIVLAWLYAVGVGLESRMPMTARLSGAFFRFNLIYLLLYTLAFQILWPAEGIRLFLGSLTTIFDIYSAVALLDVLYFVANALVSVEKGRPGRFMEYLGPAIAAFFFPVGIWFLQPRIRKIFGGF
jgi:hypothetical protein